MPEDEDRRRGHLIAIDERLAVVQHQLAEVIDVSLQSGESGMPAKLGHALSDCERVSRSIRIVLESGMLPSDHHG